MLFWLYQLSLISGTFHTGFTTLCYSRFSLQVWASNFLPNEPALAERCQRDFLQKHGEPLLVQYARMEAQAQDADGMPNQQGRTERTARSAALALYRNLLAKHASQREKAFISIMRET
ncbi:Galactose-1-phosphate uridylyltransferase [Labeo rohita]|uniref:Galactose-1-phosphate uridylyltransferase n=1 Tax=Labeo rohita TaxID=84645 RepID=A0ABQ8MB08_LABRO|nr:Galactose-1-phosphate uridylyltransferase [Labeo rohita]